MTIPFQKLLFDNSTIKQCNIHTTLHHLITSLPHHLFNDLDPLLHQQLRLSVISLLVSVKEAEFNYLKEKTDSTAGNLSVQINKLAEANYISINKTFRDNYPLTTCKITSKGIKAFELYVENLKQYINLKK